MRRTARSRDWTGRRWEGRWRRATRARRRGRAHRANGAARTDLPGRRSRAALARARTRPGRVVGDLAARVEGDLAALVEHLPELRPASLHARLHARHRDPGHLGGLA